MHGRNLLLWGPMGSGKSTVAPLVAASRGVDFVDLDDAIATHAGVSIAKLFEQRGEAAFRSIERATLDSVLSRPGRAVVALGGGALLDTELRRRLLESERIVALSARIETLAARAADSDRPLLRGPGDIAVRLEEIVAARREA